MCQRLKCLLVFRLLPKVVQTQGTFTLAVPKSTKAMHRHIHDTDGLFSFDEVLCPIGHNVIDVHWTLHSLWLKVA